MKQKKRCILKFVYYNFLGLFIEFVRKFINFFGLILNLLNLKIEKISFYLR